MMTLVKMLENNCKCYPDKTAILYKDKKISYQQLYRQSRSLAAFFVANGLKKGDRVGMIVKKDPDAIISFLGIAQAAGIFYTVDYNQPDDNIQYTIDLTRPAFLIISSEFFSILQKLDLSKYGTRIIIIGDDSTSHLTWQTAISFDADSVPNIQIDQQDPVYLNFTSGSTGTPKGAITTHDNLYWNTRAVVERFDFAPTDIHLCGFPIFTHPHELFCRALYTGGTIVLTDDFLPKTVAQAVARHKVTCLSAISLLYENLVRYHAPTMNFSTLRIAESGGMHVCSTLIESFKSIFNINITPVWGSTETTGVALTNPVGSTPKVGSMGKPCPYYEVKVVDDAGKDLGAGEIGEMVIRGAANCSGYYGNKGESAELMRDVWLYTGDLVKTDGEGFFYFITRKSRMMKVAGLKVYPSEIEEVLLKHPDVAEVAVTRVQDKILGEVPKAVVVPNANNKKISAGELRRYCAENMAKYKVPTTIEIVFELPKTPDGKILYKKL